MSRKDSRHELTESIHVSSQQWKSSCIKPRKLQIAHESCKHPKCLLLCAIRDQQQQADDEVHALTISNFGIQVRVGFANILQTLRTPAHVVKRQHEEGPSGVLLDERLPAAVLLQKLLVLAIAQKAKTSQSCLPNFPSQVGRNTRLYQLFEQPRLILAEGYKAVRAPVRQRGAPLPHSPGFVKGLLLLPGFFWRGGQGRKPPQRRQRREEWSKTAPVRHVGR
mmetsp:Transcript_8971/g.21267  ORF Transcript_8971/g.21267 Transcript_8971/m.21267 type:complete len:222 (+) Transcript_8971:147-812(+)